MAWIRPHTNRWPDCHRQSDDQSHNADDENRRQRAANQHERPASLFAYDGAIHTGAGGRLIRDRGVGVGFVVRHRAVSQRSLATCFWGVGNVEVAGGDSVRVDGTCSGILCVGQGGGRRREQRRVGRRQRRAAGQRGFGLFSCVDRQRGNRL